MSELQIRVKSPIKAAVHSLDAGREDSVGLVKQYLQSLDVLSQPMSAFSLKYKGEVVSPDLTLGELEPEATTLDFEMQPTKLRFTDVAFQIEQLRDALGLNPLGSTSVNGGATRLHEIKKGSKKGKKLSEDDIVELAALPDAADSTQTGVPEDKRAFVSRPNPFTPKPSAVQLKLSSLQPLCRSPQVKLLGIIAFVSFVSNDGKEWGFTASSAGFVHVPGLTERKLVLPASTVRPVPTLLQAIEQVSPSTITSSHKSSEKFKADPLASVSIPQVSSVAPWMVGDVTPVTNLSANKLELAVDANSRDWNEDYQSTREIVAESFSDRVARDSSLCLTAREFATAATEGAVKVVEGAITPLNPNEEDETAELYLHQGIFYTHGADFQEAYAGVNSRRDARKAVKKGINGVEQLMVLNDPELCPVLTTIVDYCGRRIVAQAPVPGIFREIPLIEYGQSEDPNVVHFSETIDKSMHQYASHLHLKAHPVNPEGLELQTSVEVHAARSTDGRVYAIDLHRMQVPDPLFEGSKELDLLRYEAVVDFYAKNPEAAKLNPDIWMSAERFPAEYAKSELPKDIEAAKAVGSYVRESLVSSLVVGVADGTGVDPIDGIHLTALMHRRGINMRHLGRVFKLAQDHKLRNLSAVAFEEALARCLKVLLNEKLSAVANITDTADVVTSFVAEFREKRDASIIAAVVERLQSHFGFSEFPENWETVFLPRLTLLRLLSLKTGLQWNEKLELVAINPIVHYSFPRSVTASEAIEAGSLSLEAVFNSPSPEGSAEEGTPEATSETTEETAKESTKELSEGTSTEAAKGATENDENKTSESSPEPSPELLEQTLTILSQTVGIYTQIYGPAHAEVAHVFNQVATLYYEHVNDTKKAIEYSRKAITISERVNGIDSHDAITMYNNLAHFERSAGHFEATLELAKRIISTIDQIAWPGFTDRGAIYTTVAVMLLQSKKEKLQAASLGWFSRAIELAKESPTGPSGILWFHYAQAQILQQDYKNAARSMDASYHVFKNRNGADDPSAKEVKGYLEQLLKLTVSSAKNLKKAPALAAVQQHQLKASQKTSAKSKKNHNRKKAATSS